LVEVRNACSILVEKSKRKRQFEKHTRTPEENIAVYLLKARTVEPEKQPLLVNGSETAFVYRKRLGKRHQSNESMRKNRVIVGNGVFYSVRAKEL
jgi:hypothetical protein